MPLLSHTPPAPQRGICFHLGKAGCKSFRYVKYMVKAHHQVFLPNDKVHCTVVRGSPPPMAQPINDPPPNSGSSTSMCHGALVENGQACVTENDGRMEKTRGGADDNQAKRPAVGPDTVPPLRTWVNSGS